MTSAVHAPCPLWHHAQARPEALALWTPDRRWTYAELDAAIAATAERLRREGFTQGARLALRMPRDPRLVILLWALWRVGAVSAPLSTRLPSTEAQRLAQRLRTRHLLTTDPELLDERPEGINVASPSSIVRLEGGNGSVASPRPIHRPATLLFTSGSTGEPKAILHSWANHIYSAKGANANMPLGPGDRWLLSLPLYHVGGLAVLVRCALAGAAVAVPGPEASVSGALARSNATHVSLVATQFRRLLHARESGSPHRVQGVLLGGGPIPSGLLRRGHAQGWPLHTSYGSTEMGSQVTTTAPGAPPADLQTAGRRLPHRRIRIADNGQILVGGATLCMGVMEDGRIRDPRVNGWYPTGDVGRVDAQGRLHVQGRIDRQFVSGGENIQPEEIELALERIEDIERAVVVAVPDEEYGQRPVAFVQTEGELRPDAWRETLAITLPGFKLPDAIYRLPSAAVEGNMKVDHDLLRQRARSG